MSKNRQLYLDTFDELHVLGETLYQDYLQGNKTIEEVTKQCEDLFIYAYLLGYQIGLDDLDIQEDEAIYYLDSIKGTSKPQESVDKMFIQDGEEKNFVSCIKEHLENEDGASSIEKVLSTEWHRDINAGIQQSAEDYTNETGKGITKTWLTVLDDKVRDTHSYLEGMTIGVNEDFYTYNGDHAPYPGLFDSASEDVNCRCTVRLNKE